jgi:hypothetical protein
VSAIKTALIGDVEQVLDLVDTVFCNIFRARYNRMLRNYNFVMYLAELYEPYVFFQGR